MPEFDLNPRFYRFTSAVGRADRDDRTWVLVKCWKKSAICLRIRFWARFGAFWARFRRVLGAFWRVFGRFRGFSLTAPIRRKPLIYKGKSGGGDGNRTH